ncbi:MAG: tripartite tricarboxylate transporter substrate binding protein [Hyphomicrobiales bacterium]|nr:tripartite tricarboxylate transporter substrate binding protein [Hyphomicrobiales bacterium]
MTRRLIASAQARTTRRALLAGAGIAAAHALAWPVRAQPRYPAAGPIRLIVPFAPAGPVDIMARIVVEPLAKLLGQSVVIENRGGAGGNIAMAAAARAKPDGYTLLLTSSVLVVNPLIYRSVSFDPHKDFVPISLIATSPNLMLARPDVAADMIAFLAKAKAQPGALNYSTPGVGTKGHFAVELLKLRAGIDLVHVPYASGSQVTQSLLTGATQLGSTALPAGEPLVRSGTLTGLVVSGESRWPTLPSVPTMVELGYSDFVAEIFTALLAPAGTPAEVVAVLETELSKLARDPAVAAKAERAGYAWIGGGAEAVRQKMAQETAQTLEVIRFSGIKAD